MTNIYILLLKIKYKMESQNSFWIASDIRNFCVILYIFAKSNLIQIRNWSLYFTLIFRWKIFFYKLVFTNTKLHLKNCFSIIFELLNAEIICFHRFQIRAYFKRVVGTKVNEALAALRGHDVCKSPFFCSTCSESAPKSVLYSRKLDRVNGRKQFSADYTKFRLDGDTSTRRWTWFKSYSSVLSCCYAILGFVLLIYS